MGRPGRMDWHRPGGFRDLSFRPRRPVSSSDVARRRSTLLPAGRPVPRVLVPCDGERWLPGLDDGPSNLTPHNPVR